MNHELYTFVAKALSVIYCFLGIGILANQEHYKEVLVSFLKNGKVMLLGGIGAICVGMYIVTYDAGWETIPASVITLVGWLGLAEGAALLTVPKVFVVFEPLVSRPVWVAGISLVTGVGLGCICFFM